MISSTEGRWALAIRQIWKRAPRRLRAPGVTAALFLLSTTFAHAADSQFLFDPNGNLLVQAANLNAPPQITGQPQNQIVGSDETASFFVVAAGSQPLTYQWRFNDADIGGATGDALLLENVSTNNEGEYRVVLTNPSGSVTSTPALLTIDSDGDGMGDSWELTWFTNLDQNATSDFDGDGSSNLDEFRNGTDPTDSNSYAFRLEVISDAGTVIKSPNQTAYTNGQSVTLTAIPPINGVFHAWLGDIVTRSNPVTLVMNNDKTVYARFTPIIFNWTSLASGDWETATNWTPQLAPNSNDTAIITSSVTVTLNTSADCADVTLGSGASNPTLTGSGTLTVRGNLLWASGTMGGSGRTIVETGATLSLDHPTALVLSGRTLENGGTAVWTDTGNIVMTSGAVITNRSGALFEVQNAAALGGFGGANGRLDNAGTFRKSANSGTMTIDGGVNFNNSGTVEIQSGTLLCNGGFINNNAVEIQSGTLRCNGSFTNNGAVQVQTGMVNLAGGGTHNGSFGLGADGALILSGGTHNANASSSVTGAGQFTASGGAANLAGLVNVSGSNTFLGGTANFTGNYICTNNTLTIAGAFTANFSGTVLVSPAVLNLSGNGILSGTSTVTVLSAMNWTGGNMSGSGRTIIAAGATLNIASASGVGLSGRTLENGGTILWTGAGPIGISSGAVITNRAGALFHAQNAAAVVVNVGSSRIDNAGTFRKSVNAGTTTVGNTMGNTISFNNYGTVEIQSGALALGGGGTHNGSFDVAAGAALALSGGTHSAGVSSSITGAGHLTVSGGTANLAGLVNVSGSNTFSGAVITGNYICTNNILTVTDVSGANQANFSGTGLVSPRVLNLINNGNLSGTSTVTVLDTMNWTGGNMSGSGRTIIPVGATLHAGSASGIGLQRTLENGGSALWSGAGPFIMLNGVITNRAGALFHAQNAAQFFFAGGACRFDNAGTFRKSANSGTMTIVGGVNFNNSGTVDIRSGILVANGGYTSTSNALLNCALGGTTPGTNFGQLQVAGTVTLNGALSVDLLPGFSPATNDTFTVITAGTRNGTNTSFTYPANRVTMQLSNTPNAVVLRVTDVLPIPQPVLLTPELASPNIRLIWTATSNVTYRLESNPDVAATNWTAVPGDVTTLSNTASKLDPLTTSNRLYRVRVLP